MKINLKPHTILLLVGPSNCGKSTFAHKIKEQIDGAFSKENDCEIVSSDDQRRYLLGRDAHKYDGDMMFMSHHAFKLLNEKVFCLSSYPVNKKYIIVDSTGLSEGFREDMIRIAKKNNYNIDCIVFRFDNKEEYYTGVSEEHKFIVEKHVNNLFRRESAKIHAKDYGQRIIVKKREDPEVILEKEAGIKISGRTLIVGDVHGCYDQLLSVLNQADYRKYKYVVINGDCVDKGPDTEKVLDFVMEQDFILVRGNHENYVRLVLNGINEHIKSLDEFFDSVYLPIKDKLNAYWDKAYDWVEHDKYVITHAPCESKYLLKSDTKSCKMQRNFRHTQYEYDLELVDTILSFYQDNIFTKKHIFGHIPFERVWETNKFIAMDTGCTQGGKLTAFDTETKQLFQADGARYSSKEVYKVKKPEQKIDLNSLDRRERTIVNNFADNKVNFISGTVCPADRYGIELESLDWALDYYKDDKCQSVVIQPKYMGSRFQVYLFPEVEQCYGITRNGFRPNVEGLEPEFQRLIDRFKSEFDNGLKLRILDCELLPWRVLGGDLIDRSFYGYYDLLKTKRDKELEYNFESVIEQVKNNIPAGSGELKKDEFVRLYGHHTWSNHKLHNLLRSVPDVEKFKEQAVLYGQDGEIQIKPFNILKDVYEDREVIRVDESNFEKWNLINDDVCIRVGHDAESLLMAYVFYSELTVDKGYEGVVVKPDIVGDLTPYIKVRNPDYLQLVYGPDYQEESKYKKLFSKKRIKGKLVKSEKDYKYGVKLLNQPYNNLNRDNYEYMETLCKFVVSERQNKGIDPRL